MIKVPYKSSIHPRDVVTAVKAPGSRECKVHNDRYLLLNNQKTITLVPNVNDKQYRIYITETGKLKGVWGGGAYYF